MVSFFGLFLHVLASPFKSRARLEAEIVFLRHQLNLLQRRLPARPRLTPWDRLLFVWLYRLVPSLLSAAVIIQPPRRLAAMGIRDHPIAPQAPWQNGHAERLLGSIRRECLDHVVILGEAHLRRVLKAYAGYYNQVRTHLALAKDAPHPRPVQRLGEVVARPILGGLHHEYCRI